jgi:pSer/pThr/pTyr-binding forkhead associated (FHA) protein
MATIYIVKGPDDGDAYTVQEENVDIGRGKECGVTLADEKISHLHLQVSFDTATKQHVVQDMRSTNGTRHNGNTITTSVSLADGDVLELGDTSIEYSSRTFPSNEAAAAARTASFRGGSDRHSGPHTMLDDSNRPF